MPYRVEFHPKVDKDFARIQPGDVRRTLAAIKEKLIADPLSTGTPLHGQLSGLYKMRVGDYRIIYCKRRYCVHSGCSSARHGL
ncbi:type II toxin-antitoxin system mRNA interferase toxin, RelE/StbE family [bacterium]|nr:MAG: type II toxin-antitoxin system mRNA interferase toxin, RelE/StbE family [bacterium]